MRDVLDGNHPDFGDNCFLIRLQDPETEFLPPKKRFSEIFYFNFLDAEDSTDCKDEHKVTIEVAQQIVDILQRAINENMNVLVHCHAGICRSGAVVEVASMMGFETFGRRIPNVRLKTMMMKCLGWSY